MPARARRTGDSGKDLRAVIHGVGDADIAHALAGEREGLGIRIADDGIIINSGDKRRGRAVEHQLAVRLVGNDVYGVAVLGALLGEELCHGFERLAGVDNAGGVIGRVDNDRLSVRGDTGGEGGDIGLERARVRPDRDKAHAVCLRKGDILREARRDADDLRILHGERADNGHERGRRAAGEEDVLLPQCRAVARVEIVRDGETRLRHAGGGRIPVDAEAVDSLDNGDERAVDLRRRGNGGVADGKVIYILAPDNGGTGVAVLKKLTYNGAGRAESEHSFVHHDIFLLIMIVIVICFIILSAGRKFKTRCIDRLLIRAAHC